MLLSACATTEEVAVAEKAIEGKLDSKTVSEKSRESTSDCDDNSAGNKSWRCRILDGKSYVIAVQENQTDVNKSAPRSPSKSSTAGQGYKYGDSVVKNFLQLNDDFYAVQIFANSNKAVGVKFINTKRLGRARLLHTQVKGRDWYVALLGVYPDLELAKKRAKAYQEVHQGVTPWVRSVKSLKRVYKATII